MIRSNTERFSEAENSLLAEILDGYEFDVVRLPAFCTNPSIPPLRDYLLLRETLFKQAA